MAKRLIVVTGFSAAGTSFTLSILAGLGYEVGLDDPFKERGNEWGPFNSIWTYCNEHILSNKAPFLGIMDFFDEVTRVKVVEYVASFMNNGSLDFEEPLPEVVKSPYFSMYLNEWIEAGGKKPDHIVFCTRDPNAIIRDSIDGDYRVKSKSREIGTSALAAFGKLLSDCQKHDVDYSVVHFPKSRDVNYMYDRLSFVKEEVPYNKFYEVHNSIFDQRLVRYG